MATANYYEILEIPTDSDEREIKRAYHRMARDLHPDKATTPEMAAQFQERFSLVSAAYNTLKDAEKRAEYDRTHKPNAGGSGAPRPGPSPTAQVLSAARGVPGGAASTAGASPTGNMQSQAARPTLGLTPEKAQIAQKAFARGMQFFKENNFIKAIDFFEAAIQNNDTDPNYHARLALALINAHKSANRAMEAAQRACDLDPYNIEHKFNLAFVYETIGSKSLAQKAYEDILKWDAGNTRATNALKDLKSKKGSSLAAKPLGGAPGGAAGAGGKAGFLQNILGKFGKK